jgi:CelD/BcsL family acetyltransferase involved in cellulose biosynthesis
MRKILALLAPESQVFYREQVMDRVSFTVEKISNIDTLESIQNVWNSLLESNDTKTVELSYEWQISYWKQFHREAELFVLIIRESSSIIAISPLKITTRQVPGIKVRCLEIIGARTSNYQDLIIGKNSDDVLICILDYLIKNQASWDQLSLRHIPETSITACFFLKKLHNYPLFRIEEIEKCTYLAIDGDWEEYKKGLGKHRRHRMVNNRMRIEREVGKVHLRKSATDSPLMSDLQDFYNLHKKRWNPTETPSEFNDERYCEFYSQAGLQLQPKGEIGLAVLEAGEATLGYLLFFVFKKNALIQLIAHDPDYSKYSPMVVLIEQFVDEMMMSGIDEIDFGSYYSYKKSWANQDKNRLNLIVFPRRFLPSAIYGITRVYLALRSWLRRNPRILNIIKIILGRASFREKVAKKDQNEAVSDESKADK